MKDISLVELLEAGCHFGHRVEKWHPKASSFIYQSREGIHIIDLAKTKAGLLAAGEFVKKLASEGKTLLFIATKRQAKGVTTEAAKKSGANYMTNRWIGGFITNWEEVKKNIDKLNSMQKDRIAGNWQKFPKHEIVKLEKTVRKLESVYAGVSDLAAVVDCVCIVDIKKESSSVREALRRNIPTIAIVDTNSDPAPIDYAIPANDDAVGSIQYIVNYLADAYLEGRTQKQSSSAETNPVMTQEETVNPDKKDKPKKTSKKITKTKKEMQKAPQPASKLAAGGAKEKKVRSSKKKE